MAHPALIVEQLVCQFLNQWHFGLQPTLHLKARSNGAIAVKYDLTASLPVPQFEECDRVPVGPSHRSGNGSRRRRRLRRSGNSSRNSTRTTSSAVDNLDDTTLTDVQTVATASLVTSSTSALIPNDDYCSIPTTQLEPPSTSIEHSINLTSKGPQPPPPLQGDVQVLDFGLAGEIMQKIDEYLCVDPSPSPQTLANFACGLNVSVIKIQQYVEWKQSPDNDDDSYETYSDS